MIHLMAALGLVLASGQSPPAAREPGLPELHRALLAEVQGEALSVAGSPALCSARGRRMASELSAPRSSSAPVASPSSPQAEQMNLQRWYFGSNACVLEYPASLSAVVTKATTGLPLDLQSSPERADRLSEQLAAVVSAVDRHSIEPTRQLLLHSLAWEIGLPLFRAAAAGSDSLLEASCHAWQLLEATRLDAQTLAAIPSSLASLPELADSPQIAASAEQIATGDPRWLEVVPVSSSHAEALLGRFSPRVFLSAPDGADREAIHGYLTQEGRGYHTLGRLPLVFDSLDAVLVLYFNALDEQQRVVPTDLVAFWQQYTFDGKIDLDLPDLPQAESKIEFRTVRFDLDTELAAPAYSVLDQKEMAHKSFVEGMPPRAGSPVTVLRGVCLRCHTKVVETFHPQAEREIEFTRPLERSGREFLSTYVTGPLEGELAKWQSVCSSVDD